MTIYQKAYRLIQPQALWILILFHIVGLIGITVINLNLFASLTAFNLLLSAFLIYVDHEGNYKAFFRLLAIVFLIGYFIELIGISTGYPFGIYTYGENLGPQIMDVPLVIGMNWFLLTISCGFVSQRIFEKRWLRILSGAALMVFIDFLIEPVADELNYWEWDEQYGKYVPALNYLGWFIVSYITQVVFQKTVSTHVNNIAVKYFFIVLAFFVLLNLFI